MGRSEVDGWAVVGGGLGQRADENVPRRRSRPEAPGLVAEGDPRGSPLVDEIRRATRPVRRDAEVDAEAFPLARPLRWLRGETSMPNEQEIALDDAFVASQREHERARRARVARRVVALIVSVAALAALAPLARAML